MGIIILFKKYRKRIINFLKEKVIGVCLNLGRILTVAMKELFKQLMIYNKGSEIR